MCVTDRYVEEDFTSVLMRLSLDDWITDDAIITYFDLIENRTDPISKKARLSADQFVSWLKDANEPTFLRGSNSKSTSSEAPVPSTPDSQHLSLT